MDLKRYITILREQPAPVTFLISYVLWKTHLCKLFKFKFQDITIHFFPTAFSASLWVDPTRNSDDFNFIKSYCKQGDIIVDVGANIGTHSLVASRCVGDTGRVIAFEPHPKLFSYCLKNIKLNKADNIHVINAAIGDKEETSFITDDHIDDMNKVGKQIVNGIKIKVRTLDSYNLPSIDLLKVDVEGYEKNVFLGAPETLMRTQCMVFESSPNSLRSYNTSTAELIAIMHKYGFEVFHRTLKDTLELLDESYSPTVWEDLYAIRDKENFILRTGYTIR